jgi:hypothetical protein
MRVVSLRLGLRLISQYHTRMPLPAISVELVVQPHPAHVPPSEYSDDAAVQAFYAAQPATALRFIATLFINGKPAWEADVDSEATARQTLDRCIADAAEKRGVDFRGLVDALQRGLRCAPSTAFAIAMAFAFPPGPLALEHVRFRWALPRGKGHPIAADELTRHLSNLAEGWSAVTGAKPGTAERSYFVQALVAAQPFIPWLTRRSDGEEIADLRKVVRTELKKLDFDKIEFVRLPWSP